MNHIAAVSNILLRSLPFLFVVFLIAFAVIRRMKKSKLSQRESKASVEAEIIEKRVDYSSHRNSTFNGRVDTACTVTFQTAGNERLELRVEPKVYETLTKGMRGKLTLRGTTFVGFEQ